MKPKSTNKLRYGYFYVTIQADFCDLIQTAIVEGKTYLLTFKRAQQRDTRVHLVKYRTEIADYCHKLVQWLEENTNKKVNRLRSDNGAKYLSLRSELNEIGVAFTV